MSSDLETYLDALETFVVELGRASKRGSRHLRGLSPADRDDVIATAVAHCWENREFFDQHVQPLDDWFAEHLRAARRARGRINADRSRMPQRAELPGYARVLSADSDTPRAAAAAQSVEQLDRELTARDLQIAQGLGEGSSPEAIAARLGISRKVVRTFQKRIRKMRDVLLPDGGTPVVLEPGQRQYSSDPDERADEPFNVVDRQLAALSAMPRHRKDCPVCWRCSWYAGYAPANYVPSEHTDPEMREAIRATESRKIEIAGSEQRGSTMRSPNESYRLYTLRIAEELAERIALWSRVIKSEAEE